MEKWEENVTEQTYIPYWHFSEMRIQIYLYLYLHTETNTGKYTYTNTDPNTDTNSDKNTDTNRKESDRTNLHSFVTFFWEPNQKEPMGWPPSFREKISESFLGRKFSRRKSLKDFSEGFQGGNLWKFSRKIFREDTSESFLSLNKQGPLADREMSNQFELLEIFWL